MTSASHRCSPGSATPDTVRRGRRRRRPRSRRSAACCCTTCTPWPDWCSWRSWCAGSTASYRDGRSGSASSLSSGTGTVFNPHNLNKFGSFLLILTGRFLADEAVRGGRARVGFEAGHLRPLQVGAEPRVAGLTGQPAQAGVGEGGRVLPAPVGHVDLPQTHPGRQHLRG